MLQAAEYKAKIKAQELLADLVAAQGPSHQRQPMNFSQRLHMRMSFNVWLHASIQQVPPVLRQLLRAGRRMAAATTIPESCLETDEPQLP